MIPTPRRPGQGAIQFYKTPTVSGNSGQFRKWPQSMPTQSPPNSATFTTSTKLIVQNNNLQKVQQLRQSSYNPGQMMKNSAPAPNIDSASFNKVMADVKLSGDRFNDESFPANMGSLVKIHQNKQSEWANTIWLRPDQFYGEGSYQVFQGKIEPNDIKQGAIGDCYFLSALATLAEWPERIQNIFITKQANSNGCYCVKICDMGEWKEVVIDDLFPCSSDTNQPIFTRGNDKELWVLILEKVWAKIHASYDAIESGLTTECLHDFTGAPTKYVNIKNEDSEQLWNQILEGENKQFAMACGVGAAEDQTGIVNSVTPQGLVTSHAYSLLSGHEVDTDYGRVRLVRLRNPWGQTEWNGAWSDSSSEWTPELRQQLGWEDTNDGIFFMSYEDFCQYYSDVQFCYIHDDYKYNSQKVTSNTRNAAYFRVQVDTSGEYYFSVNQESQRKNAHNPNFSYSYVSMVIAKSLGNGQYEYVAGERGADREVWTKAQLTPGEYLVYAKVSWNSGRDSDFVLSTYGVSDTAIEVVNKQDYPNLLEQTFLSKARQAPQKNVLTSLDGSNCYRNLENSQEGFVYVYYQNKLSKTLEIDGTLQLQNTKVRKPFRGSNYKLVIPPNEERIILMKMMPNQAVSQGLSESLKWS